MCGRFTLTYDIQTIAQAFHAAPTLQTTARYNIAPTQQVVTVLQNGERHLDLLRWGLIPSWAKEENIGSKMINARAETLAEKPSFKRLLHSRRCLIVADGFYEWKQEQKGPKTPMYITLKDHELFAFAGLWDSWKQPDGQLLRTCTIITTEANELVSSIHNRMPVILPNSARDAWLDVSMKDDHILLPLLKPYVAEEMMVRPVSRLVNDPKKDSAELIA
jgi:putative SOS response-associated peptidase YedK